MKSIRLDVLYPPRETRAADGQVSPTWQRISLSVIILAVNTKYTRQGQSTMELPKLKMWSKIQDKIMDENGDPVVGAVELSDEQFDFLYDAVTTSSYPPGFATVVTVYADYLDKVKLAEKVSVSLEVKD